MNNKIYEGRINPAGNRISTSADSYRLNSSTCPKCFLLLPEKEIDRLSTCVRAGILFIQRVLWLLEFLTTFIGHDMLVRGRFFLMREREMEGLLRIE